VLKTFYFLLLILVAPLLLAQSTDSGPVTLPATAGMPGDDLMAESESADQLMSDMVKVVTRGGRPADCLAPVAINRIDGESRLVPAQGFLIEAGVHTLNGLASLDISSCPFADDNLQIRGSEDFEVLFERGGTYHIAYDHSSENSDQWSLVVWKVELPVPSYEDTDN
jgi:hypothetical protein